MALELQLSVRAAMAVSLVQLAKRVLVTLGRAQRVEQRLQPLQMHRNTLRGIWSGRTSRLHATSRMHAAFQAATLPLQMPRKEIWSARAGSWSRFKCYGK